MIVIPEVSVLPSEQKAASNQGLLVKCAVMAKFYFDGRQALFPIKWGTYCSSTNARFLPYGQKILSSRRRAARRTTDI